MQAFSQKLADEFSKMRLRTRIAICTRLALAVFLAIAGLIQIVYL